MPEQQHPENNHKGYIAQEKRPIRVALVSCGLGNVKRGFEVSTDRWYQALKEHPGLEVKLFRGGMHPRGKFVLNIPRDWVMNSPLAVFKLLNRRRFWEFCYGVEQVSFGLFYWPELVLFKPDIVWTKEVPFGYFLPIYRALFGMKFKTVFANGGAFSPATYKDFDFIQHLTQESFDQARNFGIAADKMEAITNLVNFKKTDQSRTEIRKSFGFADEDFIVICVSAWNAYHKRIDYLINEVSSIADSRVKLLLCGHPDAETDVLKHLAKEKLGQRVKWMSLDEHDVHRALQASDVFVLPSLQECLGNSIVEAALAQIPAVVHDNVASRFIFGPGSEWIADLTQPMVLRDRLLELRADPDARLRVAPYQERVKELFSREALISKFYDMVANLAEAPSHSSNLGRAEQLGKQT